jgi:polyribonucleotide nucleotidyltransferase
LQKGNSDFMSEQPKEFQKAFAGRDLIFTVGKFAGQADAAVTVRYGDTVVLGTCVMGPPKPDRDFMPLLVEYEEKFYAAGKIKGSRFVKREGRPTDSAVTTGRLVDRSIRPLFPKGLRNDIQVVATVLSYDGDNEPDTLALLAASAALSISKIPWQGPLGAVHVGRVGEQFVVNPTRAQRDAGSDLDLVVAANDREAVMIEADANELSEEVFLAAVAEGTRAASELARFIQQIAADVGVPKVAGEFARTDDTLARAVRTAAHARLEEALKALKPKTGTNTEIKRLVETAEKRLQKIKEGD